MRLFLGTAALLMLVAGLLVLTTRPEPLQRPPEPHERPNDWFFRQRAYPFNDIPHDAWLRAKDQARAFKRNNKAGPNWQLVGPTNVIGRIAGLTIGHEGRVVAGAASGGIWLSDDLGDHWTPLTGEAGSVSIGDLDAAPSNRNIIYAGTGEPNGGGGSLTYGGMGVLKSTDNGTSWLPAGLREVRHIGRIRVHPTDPETVYVAAMGNLFSENPARGLYRTRDGGNSWQQVLYVAPDTGCVDLVIDADNPNILYTSTWQRLRTPENRSYGGPECHIYRSKDAGDTWELLTNGLPTEDKGRIGLAISSSDTNRLYAMYSNELGEFAGIYRSDDGGDTWRRTSDEGMADSHRTYGWWFGRIQVHPTDPDFVFALGFQVHISRDGGATWRLYEDIYLERHGESPSGRNNVHVDQHALVFHPDDPNTNILGNDGGIYLSTLPEVEWVSKPGLAIAQFYSCEISETNPERIYGGLQDNGTFSTPDSSLDNWTEIYGGDGQHVIEHPTNPNMVYVSYQYGTILGFLNGNFFDTNFYTLPETDRANWTAPYLLDPNNPDIKYFGSQRVYRTEQLFNDMIPISDDLTKGPGSGNQAYGTLTALDIPKADSNVIYAGTDDGNAWVTMNMGETWTNISAGLPQRWITDITAHPEDPNTAYITLSGYRNDEYQPHVLVTRNAGSDWTDISSNLPEAPVNDLIIANDTLIIASDTGVFASANDGDSWQSLGSNLPLVPVNALDWHQGENFILAATFGRSMYKLDLNGIDLTTSQGSQKAHTRFLADVRVDQTHDTYLGVVNPTTHSASIELIAFDSNGNALQTVTPEALPPNGRFAEEASALFSVETQASMAWVQVGADQMVISFAEQRLPEARSAYAAVNNLEQATWLPHVAADTASFQTVFASVNGADKGLNQTIQVGLDGTGIPIPQHRAPLGQTRQDLRAVFGDDLSSVTFAKLQGDSVAAASMEYFTALPNQDMIAAMGLHGRTTETLHFLHVATDTVSFWTGLVALNVSNTTVTLTEERYDAAGNLLEMIADVALAPGSKRISVFNDTTTAGVSRVVMRADGPLVGYELFGSNPTSGNRLFAGLQAADQTGATLVFPHVEANGWTGLVAVNLGAEPDTLTFTAFDANGQALATAIIENVAAGERVTRAAAALFPDQTDIAWVRAEGRTAAWSGFQLWGTGTTTLSGIGAAVIDSLAFSR